MFCIGKYPVPTGHPYLSPLFLDPLRTDLFPSAAEHGFSGDAELVPDASPEAGSGDHLPRDDQTAGERIVRR